GSFSGIVDTATRLLPGGGSPGTNGFVWSNGSPTISDTNFTATGLGISLPNESPAAVPVLLAASSSTGTLNVAYTLTGPAGSLPAGQYTVQFFDNGTNSVSQGKTFLGQQTINWNGSTGTFVITGLPAEPLGDFITAVATTGSGSDSPGLHSTAFSAPL